MKKLILLILTVGAVFYAAGQKKSSYLSSLNAGKKFPLYTTYAAAQERSDFILDEGYEFKYDSETSGADFITDTGGDICLGFRKKGQWVYRISEMYKPPVITNSYPDLVKYEYEPFEGIKVSASFLTYSSRAALLDLAITNTGNEKVEIDLFPFMRSNNRSFHTIKLDKEKSMASFSHEEYPDGWTLSQKLPYTDSICNILMLSTTVDEAYAFSSEAGESPIIPSEILLTKKPTKQLTGRLFSTEGERLAGASPINRLQLIIDDNDDILLTEKSSVWGTKLACIEPDGYFRIEAGNINIEAKKYRLTGYNEKIGKQASVIGTFKEGSARCDLKLTDSSIPVIKDIRINNNRIEWLKPEGIVSFSVYRRTYPEVFYRRIAKEISEPTFVDTQADKTRKYGYVVTCSVDGLSGIQSREVLNIPNSDFAAYIKNQQTPQNIPQNARIISLSKKLELNPGITTSLRVIRSVSAKKDNQQDALIQTKKILKTDINSIIKTNEKQLSEVKTFDFQNEKQEALFWSNVNMMRQVFYPPQAKSKYNYYVFSREPTWGWGHGGQVFHESITMLAYADVDPKSAMNSQRVFSQRQYPNGYINYRTGSFLDEIIESNGELTSSAPWYSWLNWEVFKMTKDKKFLKEMYQSSVKFYNFYTTNRDKDRDGLCEWGGEAVLESVRDAQVAVWDEVGYPANFEGLDLNCLLVMEAKSLEAMARELGLNAEAEKWKADHEKRTILINKYCWDKETGFYYNVNKTDHSFSFKKNNDLKRMEIIGFLPLWAGITNEEQTKSLVSHLTNPAKFWRKYGIPSLAADDSFYNDKGYWNGPVWVQWNYLIERGLLQHGYKKEAIELVEKVSEVMVDRLANDHNLWEFYSPDNLWGGHHKTYIWTGIVNRMIKEVNTQK